MPYRRLLQFQGLAFTAVVVAAPTPGDGTGFSDQIEAILYNQQLLQYQAVAAPVFTPVAEVVTVDKWYEPLSEPTRRIPGPQYQQFHTTSVFVSEENNWPYEPFSEPRRFRVSVPAQQQQFIAQDVLSDAQLTDTFESRWHQPWSDPTRLRWASQAALLATSTWSTFTPETVTLDKWFAPFREPVREKPGLLASLQQTTAIDPYALTQPETVTESKWHHPWSEPVRVKQGLATYLQHTLELDPFPRPTTLTTASWYLPLAEPVRQKIGLLASLQQTSTIDPYILTQPEQISEDKWHQPWSEPVRQKSGLGTWLQKATDIDPFPRPTEQITVGNWYLPLTEPVRQKPGLRANLQQFATIDPYALTQPETVSEDRWHQPWSDPTRRKWPLQAAELAGPIWSSFTPEVVTPDKWFSPLSEPKRPKKGLEVSLQGQPNLDPFPRPADVTLASWFEPLADPVRLKVGLRSTYQSFLAADTEPTPTSKNLAWFIPLIDPVRTKLGLRSDLQDVTSRNIEPIIPSSQSWFESLSEPIRLNLKIGLKAWLQQFFTTNTETPAGVTVTVTLSATETNGDIFTGAVFVTDEPPPFTEDPYALVSIVEVESGDGLTPTSIIES